MAGKTGYGRPLIRLALSRVEVAQSIGVSVSSVDKMIEEGALPPPRKWHSRKLWLVSEVEAYLNEWPSMDGSAPDDRPVQDRTWLDDTPHQRYLDMLGGDPDEFRRQYQAAKAEWRASIPNSPLNKRERAALTQFSRPGIEVEARTVKGAGIETAERLEARGYIEIHFSEPNRVRGYVLTDKGMQAREQLLGVRLPITV
ncbi:hypothetical protein OSH10_04980 [Kaistia defluvii]|uniref:helix-turn-helix transcriptional regulator n=1 Tax=Kaistia defluvii TaxID=410841 RepID=UPI0022504597|nr:hypothetical protein [Kaistia defluvii]MCX5517780.1 hypothetical protein [Kaistia defluvii]